MFKKEDKTTISGNNGQHMESTYTIAKEVPVSLNDT